MNNKKSILAVGSVALDSLKTNRGYRTDVLGGSATYFGIAASLFTDTKLVGVVGSDFPQAGWNLFKDRGIHTSNIQVHEGPTFRWGGKYSPDFSTRETLFTELGVFEGFKPVIGPGDRSAEFVFLGNIQPGLQLDVVDLLPDAECIICDTMNLWINCNVDVLWRVVRQVNMFLLNDEEALQLTGSDDVHGAAKILLNKGPSVIVIKQGARGAYLATRGLCAQVPVFPLEEIYDPTGAGDSFAGGFVGHLVQNGTKDLVEAVITGAAVASFTVSGFGVEGLLRADLEKINQRKHHIRLQMSVTDYQ